MPFFSQKLNRSLFLTLNQLFFSVFLDSGLDTTWSLLPAVHRSPGMPAGWATTSTGERAGCARMRPPAPRGPVHTHRPRGHAHPKKDFVLKQLAMASYGLHCNIPISISDHTNTPARLASNTWATLFISKAERKQILLHWFLNTENVMSVKRILQTFVI